MGKRLYMLTRYEEIDVDYTVEAESVEEAVRKVESYDTDSFVREEGGGDYFEGSDLRYLGEDGDWHHPGADSPPATKDGPLPRPGPDLLEAAKAISRAADRGDNLLDHVDALDAAIAKAEGGDSC